MQRVALVTGGNRGLGLETVRGLAAKGYRVALGSRKPREAEKAIVSLGELGKAVFFLPLDTTESTTLRNAIKHLDKYQGRLDVLVNNAGILPSRSGQNTLEAAPRDELRAAMETNAFGAFELIQHALPLMRKNKFGRIVNVSSGMGQLSEMGTGYAAYRLSKTALNAVTKMFAEETKGENILVNSVCPGWVKTDMGGPNAERSLEQGSASILWAALIPDGGPTGGFFRDGKPLSW